MIDNKMHNNVSNSSLNNVINLIQNILQENRNNRTKTSDNNSLNIFADFNKELSKDYNVNTNSPTKNNNNNFYSNVHIKTITNIKELISNNLNNNNNNPNSSNNSNSNTYNLKNSNSLIYQNNLSFDNSNNDLDQSSKSILKTNASKKRNGKIKKFVNSNRPLNKKENHNNSYYHLGKSKYNINNFLTTRKFHNPNENNIKKVNTESVNNNNKNNNNNDNNADKQKRTSIKSGNSKRMSLKSYIKKVKNLYILKKLSNNKKREIKNGNRTMSAINISMGDDEMKENNNKDVNNITFSVYKGKEIEDNNNNRNDSEKKDKENLNNNNKAANLKSNNKDNKDKNEDTHKKEVTIKDNKENNHKKNDNSNSSTSNSHRNRQKSIHSRTAKSKKKNNNNNNNQQSDNTQNITTNVSKKSNHTSKPLSKFNTDKNFENMSPREKSYYLLSLSPILRLTERLFFGRATENLRKVQPVKIILENNEIFLKDKVKELEEKLVECEKKIITPFNASKTAEIAFNFILTKDEDEFKTYILFSNNEEEKKEYYNYTKIIYLLFDEDYENVDEKDLNENLYDLIGKKGFESIKDYLYYIFINKRENIDVICKMDKINGLLEQSPTLVNKQFDVKFCRFVLFTSFLINEIIHYGNDVKNAIELKVKTREYLDIVLNKLELYKLSQK